jgi:flagellar assembly protein FliH
MSTSPKPAPAAGGKIAELQPFPYDAVALSSSRGMPAPTSSAGNRASTNESAAREAQARAEGRNEGQAEARKGFEAQLAKERAAVASALAAFVRDRAAYFAKVEAEVVQLALGIARRILHREAQLDPLLLASMVRVSLEKLDAATRVSLRLHPQHANAWRTYLSTQLAAGAMPEIVEDPAQPLETCTLDTSVGTSEIGWEKQLKEIENGLMDLMAARPGMT